MEDQTHLGKNFTMSVCPNCGATWFPETEVLVQNDKGKKPTAHKTVLSEIRETLELRHGQEYADRAIRHLQWIAEYDSHGAPGHMEYVLIQVMLDLLATR
jgi:hypothetical protein